MKGEPYMEKRIYRSTTDQVIGGVCGGLGEYFEIDPTIIRLVWAIAVFAGVGFLAYIIAWIVIPEKPRGYDASSFQSETADFQSDSFQKPKRRRDNTSVIVGAILVFIGASYIVQRFFRFIRIDQRLILSVFLIIIGAYILTKKKNK